MSLEESLSPITVWLAGRSYRILIRPEEEELVHKAIKTANDKIGELRQHYAGKDDQDFIAMCLLMYAANSATDGHFNPLIQDELKEINKKLDTALDIEEMP